MSDHAAGRARDLIRNAIAALVRDAGGRMVTRPMFRDRPEEDLTRTEPEPLAGIRAAVSLGYAVTRVTAECARYAREDGRTWGEIGEALYGGDGALAPPDRAVEAFHWFASDRGHGPSFAWTCPACRKTVIDRGPETGNPADAEQGHAEGCTRLAKAVAAYDAQWGDDDTDGTSR